MAARTTALLPLLLAGSLFAVPRSLRIPLISDSRGGTPSTWHYTTDDPGSGWVDTDFNDDAWQAGPGGFGTGTPEHSHLNTPWATGQIWLRTAFALPDIPVQTLLLSLHHDEDVQVYLNGQPIFDEPGFLTDYYEPALSAAALQALKPGKNVLAIQCSNTDGSGYIDAGLAALSAFEATVLVADARDAAPSDWSYTTADPGQDWANPDFNDSAWETGKSGFGSAEYASLTPWTSPDIWMRTTFLSGAAAALYSLSFMHDDRLETYLNGTLVQKAGNWNLVYEDSLSGAVRQAIVIGKNVLAVHCHNNYGSQFIDVGLSILVSPVATRLRAPAAAPASRRGTTLFWDEGRGVDLAGLEGGGRLTVFGIDGRVAVMALVRSGVRSLTLPATLGTGVFRYRWDFPPASHKGKGETRGGSLQGTLLKLP
jgi:hypothetical protein